MIIVRMMGGLGNQMFQYAFAQELKLIYGEEVCYSLESYETDKQRTLAITNFQVDEIRDWTESVGEKERSRILRDFSSYRILQRIIRVIRRDDVKGKRLYNWYLKRGYYFNVDPYYYGIPKVNQPDKVAYGYFQGEPYFQDCIPTIKNQFVIRENLPLSDSFSTLAKEIHSCNAVCVHIRIGDYKDARNKRFDVTTDEYIKRGIEYVAKNVENPVFFVFTNDPIAVEREFSIPNAVYVQGLKDYEDFTLMTKCKYFVISNSTFSWWVSYLAEYDKKFIIVPQNWRNNQRFDPALMNSKGITYIKL